MPETYIPLKVAAFYEGVDYDAMKKRVQRTSNIKTKDEPREFGKACTLISVSSLSPKARKLYRAEQKSNELQGVDLVIETIKDTPTLWYLEIDHHWYMQHYPENYEKAQAFAVLMREFTDYCGSDRTGYAIDFAREHGLSTRSLYRCSQDYLTASAWGAAIRTRHRQES